MSEIITFHRSLVSEINGSCPDVAVTSEITSLLEKNCIVAIGVSGGKDSDACAIAVDRYLNDIGHRGPRVLVHADLGRVEWKDSLPSCQRLARRIGWELMVVRRTAGDMLARWQGRWSNNVARYEDLSCVRIILPWSTPSMRFCTSELKVAVITSALKKRYPGQPIINASGIRRQESPNRAKMPVSASMAKLARKDAAGLSWNPIIEWEIDDVWRTIDGAGLERHEAYVKYGASRVSCAYCIMSTSNDLRAAASCADNVPLYIDMVTLEADSTFAFQGGKWLADIAPHLLPAELKDRIGDAKLRAQKREAIESVIPKHLLYTAGWPTRIPTPEEADMLADVRRQVSSLLSLNSRYLSGEEVTARYAHLMAQNAIKGAAKKTVELVC
jgi:3'-phosphoadenosine 5'-phosphosulfate sulfotransferase (PAPS reductase)/FAD synthetase